MSDSISIKAEEIPIGLKARYRLSLSAEMKIYLMLIHDISK